MMNKLDTAPFVLAATFLVICVGVFLGFSLPNSLLPNITRPQIELFTSWPGKSAQEIEQSLITPLEQRLANLSELAEMTSGIRDESAVTVLSFQSGADMKQAYIDVLAASSQVPNWPSQVAKPFIEDYSNGASATLASFFVYSKDRGSKLDRDALVDAYRFYIEPAFAKVPGVSAAVVSTAVERRVDIEFDPKLMAKYSLTLDQVISRLNNLTDRSGGSLKLGSREYNLQFRGKVSLAALGETPIALNDQRLIRLKDIAKVKRRLASDWYFFALEGKQSLYFFLQPTKNANALETIKSIKTVMAELNAGPLADVEIEIAISRDDSVAIRSALWQVYGGLILGALLACGVLYYFLRQARSVLLIFMSIPFCLAAVSSLMFLAGFSLNVVSLAGLALSTGLILDASIIVLETITRLRRTGLDIQTSIFKGIQEVRGAIISSTLSSIIVFLPMLFMASAEGRLFNELAFTISGALAASALFALVVLPVFYKTTIRSLPSISNQDDSKLFLLTTLPARHRKIGMLVLIISLPIAVLISYWVIPPIDVLPDPKQNVVSTFVRFQTPLSSEAIEQDYAKVMVRRIDQQLKSNPDLPIRTHGMFCFPTICQVYFYLEGDWQYQTFKQWVETNITQDLVATSVFSRQGGLLRFAMPNSRETNLDIRGASLFELQAAGLGLLEFLKAEFPDANIEESSPLTNRSAKIEFTPKQDQLIYYGMNPADLNQHLLALSDGVYLGEFYTGRNTLPFYLRARPPEYMDQMLDTELMIEGHGLVPIRQLASAEIKLGPEQIQRVNRALTVSLSLSPPNHMPMGEFLALIQPAVKTYMQSKHSGLHINYRGSADNLALFLQEFVRIFLMALLILAILLYLTLNSWKLAAAVLLSMPLAVCGGMLNLRLLNLIVPQNLDVITMIGFIILMGLVINNAILLVSKYSSALNRGLNQHQAIMQAVDERKRAIYMSTGTSIIGMLPLMISPANSAEIYRGLAAVIFGGMVFSALFSISFMSALLSLPLFGNRVFNNRGGRERWLTSE